MTIRDLIEGCGSVFNRSNICIFMISIGISILLNLNCKQFSGLYLTLCGMYCMYLVIRCKL